MSDSARRKEVVAGAAPDDPTIPVLTERLTLPELELDFTLPPAPQPQPQPPAPSPAPALPEASPAPPEPFRAVFEVPAPSEPRVPARSSTSLSVATSVARAERDAEAPRSAGPLARHAAPAPPASAPAAAAQEAGQRTPPVPPRSTVVPPSPDAAGPPAAASPWDPARIDRVQIELREAILTELAQRLPQDVETIVRAQMAGAIDAAVNRLAQEARFALASSLREIVDRAVRAELDRLRATLRR